MSFVWQKKRCRTGVSSRNFSKIALTYSRAKLVPIEHLSLEGKRRVEESEEEERERIFGVWDTEVQLSESTVSRDIF